MELPVTVVYDANTLYSAPLRDLFIRLALAGLVRARWSNAIHEEWMRSVVLNQPTVTREKAERVRDLMDLNVRDGLVTGYENLIDGLKLPDPDDRHVLAAAIHTKAEAIVTFNLKDFPASLLAAHSIVAMHPDEFVAMLFDAAPGSVCGAVKRQREALRNPPKTTEELLATLENQGLIQTVIRLKPFINLI
ncbi:PIN domain-containing protein [Lacunimicrobium album]